MSKWSRRLLEGVTPRSVVWRSGGEAASDTTEEMEFERVVRFRLERKLEVLVERGSGRRECVLFTATIRRLFTLCTVFTGLRSSPEAELAWRLHIGIMTFVRGSHVTVFVHRRMVRTVGS